jgi:hypothetical protein
MVKNDLILIPARSKGNPSLRPGSAPNKSLPVRQADGRTKKAKAPVTKVAGALLKFFGFKIRS